MTLSVAGRPLRSARTLSEPAQLTLACIDGGMPWVQWASESTAERYDFADERSLLDAVQQGLHGAPMIWLPRLGLQIGPAKLLTMSGGDAAALRRAESGEDSAALAREVQRVLAAHDLVTNAELASGDAFLAELGVDAAPLLQVLGFDERVAVWRLAVASAQLDARAARRREAAGFALAQARTPLEFCDYYRYYLQSAADGGSAATRQQATTDALHALLPSLFDALNRLRFDSPPSPSEMQYAVVRYLATGRTVGFPRLSLAAQQIASQAPRLGSDSAGVRRAVASVLQTVQASLGSGRLRPGRVGQDGTSLQFLVEEGQQRVLLQLAGNALTIAELAVPLAPADTTAEAPSPALAWRDADAAAAPPPSRQDTGQRLEQAQRELQQALEASERLVEAAQSAATAAIRQASEAADATINAALQQLDAAVSAAKNAAAGSATRT